MQSINKTNVKETNIFGKTFARSKQMHYLCKQKSEQMQRWNIKTTDHRPNIEGHRNTEQGTVKTRLMTAIQAAGLHLTIV